jgi:phosphatidylcholine synthase
VLAALVFVPIHYVYPSRTRVWQGPTVLLGAVWGVLMMVMVWGYPAIPRTLFWASLAYPVYYTVLSAFLSLHRPPRR